jgi:hypothetical protein
VESSCRCCLWPNYPVTICILNTVGAGFSFHVLRFRTHFGQYRECRIPFCCFELEKEIKSEFDNYSFSIKDDDEILPNCNYFVSLSFYPIGVLDGALTNDIVSSPSFFSSFYFSAHLFHQIQVSLSISLSIILSINLLLWP